MLGVALDKGIRHTLETKVKTGAIVSRLSRFLQMLFFSDKANIAVYLICLLKQETKKLGTVSWDSRSKTVVIFSDNWWIKLDF